MWVPFSCSSTRVTGGKSIRPNMPTLEGVGMAPEDISGRPLRLIQLDVGHPQLMGGVFQHLRLFRLEIPLGFFLEDIQGID